MFGHYLLSLRQGVADAAAMDRACTVVVEANRMELRLFGKATGAAAEGLRVAFAGMDLGDVAGEIAAVGLQWDGEAEALPVCAYRPLAEETERTPGSAEGTALFDVVASDVPWSAKYELGLGVNALNNVACARAVKPIAPAPSAGVGSLRVSTSIDVVDSAEAHSSRLAVELSGRYTIRDFDFGGSLSYLNEVQCSSKTLSVVLSEEVVEKGYEGTGAYQLTPDAQAYLRAEGAEKFRDRFGDYFVADVRRGARFIAVYVCEANTRKELNQFDAEFSLQSKKFDVATKDEFQELLEKHHIRLKAHLFFDGCKGVIPFRTVSDTADVGRALAWFNDHIDPAPLFAKLYHYSMLPECAALTNRIPGDLDLLVKAKAFYASLWRLKADVAFCPPNYSEGVKARFAPLYDKAVLDSNRILDRCDLIDEYAQKTAALQAQTTDILRRYQKYLKIKADAETEPKQKEKMRSSEATVWRYGLSDYPGCILKEEIFRAGWKIGWQERDFHFQEPGKTIVGYELISNWTDGSNGDWWKTSYGGLLGHRLDLHISSYYDKGCDWTIRAYLVDDSAIDFAE